MFGRVKKKAQDARGANLVEFAIVLVLLLLVLGGIADLGRAFSTYIAIANAAREGARYGARLPCITTPSNKVALSAAIRKAVTDEAATSRVDITKCNPIVLNPDPEGVGGCASWTAKPGGLPLVVTVSCPFETGMGSVTLLGVRTGLGNFTMTAKGTMAIFGND